MRNSKIGYKIVLGLMFIVLTLGYKTTVYATSATIGFTTESTVISKGNAFTVTLTVDATEAIGELEAYIAYDSKVLEFVEGNNQISGGDGILRLSDTGLTDVAKNKTYKIRFKGVEVGNSEIKLSETPVIYDYENGQEMSVSTNRISISVKATKRESNDTSLSELKISPASIEPAFESGIFEYSASVGSDVSAMVVSAVPKDAKASVKVKGNENLTEGENEIVITVTAQSGDTKDYRVLVNKEVVSDSEEHLTEEEETIEGFQVYKEEGRTFIVNSYQYEVIPVPEGIEVPVGYSKTKLILYGIQVEAYTVTNDLENDFLLIYAMNEEGAAGFYQYDRIEKTMMRYMGPTASEHIPSDREEITSEEYKTKLTQLSIVIALLSALCALLTIIIIRLYMKSKGYKTDELD